MTKDEELERLARAATPGPWVWEHGELFNPEIREQHRRVIGSEPYEGQWIDDEGPDAAFIAAANPATVLALLSANREMREREEGLRLELAKHDASYAECRIDGARPQSNTARPCDLCGARSSEPCGRKASASYAFIKAARSALTTQRGDGE